MNAARFQDTTTDKKILKLETMLFIAAPKKMAYSDISLRQMAPRLSHLPATPVTTHLLSALVDLHDLEI